MSQENSKPANGCGCLVLLMFIGVLIAIALPSYMSTVNKSKQSQAKQYVSLMNRSQQAEFAENGAFSDYIPDLELSIKTGTNGTKWYNYSTLATKQAAFNYGVSKQEEVKSYVGAVFLVPAKKVDRKAAKDRMTTTSILCETDDRSTIKTAEPIYQNGKVICGKGTTEVPR
ncbi:MAG: type IV pilin-like G/H family protein [Microcoleus sp.]